MKNQKKTKNTLSNQDIEKIRSTLDSKGYELIAEVGVGAFAHVFKIYSRHYSEYFAAKVFPIGSPSLAKNISSFTTEFGALSSVYHPNIINLYTHFSDEANLYIIIDFCSGGSVMDMIRNHQAPEPQGMLFWIYQISSALEACHKKGVAHHDVKPANILLDNPGRLKLADFGLSLLTQHQSFTNRISGSLPYLAPETLRNAKYDPFKADMWSLGITFYVLSTFSLPYKAKDDQEMIRQVADPHITFPDTMNENIKSLLSQLLVVDPEQRPLPTKFLSDPLFDQFKKVKAASFAHSSIRHSTFLAKESLFGPRTQIRAPGSRLDRKSMTIPATRRKVKIGLPTVKIDDSVENT